MGVDKIVKLNGSVNIVFCNAFFTYRAWDERIMGGNIPLYFRVCIHLLFFKTSPTVFMKFGGEGLL